MVHFGINIGSTNVCLAVCKEGSCDVIANDSGDRVTPACVALTGDETFVGITAKQQKIRNPQSVITHVLATLDGCLNGNSGQQYCKVITEGDTINYEVPCEGKNRRVEICEVLKLVFKKMLDIARNQIGGEESSYDVVLSVPQHFERNKAEKIRSAAKEAGFNVIDLINRPTASVLAYGLGQSKVTDDMNVMIYRVGGVSTDVSVVQVLGGMYFLSESLHKSSLGGDFFTELLLGYLLKEFQRMSRCDPSENKRAISKLRNAAENCKHVLSTMSTAHCFIESLCEGLDFSANVSRARFDSLISSHIASYIQPIHSVLENAIMDRSSISKVILCGGALKTPKLQQAVVDTFPGAQVLFSIAPDEVIAQGAAMHAALCGEKPRCADSNMAEISVSITSLYLKISDESGSDGYFCVLPSGTPVPTRRQHTYKPASGETSARLSIYSKPDSSEEYSCIAQIVLNEVAENAEIHLTLHVRSDGSIHISANTGKDGQNESVVIAVDES